MDSANKPSIVIFVTENIDPQNPNLRKLISSLKKGKESDLYCVAPDEAKDEFARIYSDSQQGNIRVVVADGEQTCLRLGDDFVRTMKKLKIQYFVFPDDYYNNVEFPEGVKKIKSNDYLDEDVIPEVKRSFWK